MIHSPSHITVRAHGASEGEGLRILNDARPIVRRGRRRRIATVSALLRRSSHIIRRGSRNDQRLVSTE